MCGWRWRESDNYVYNKNIRIIRKEHKKENPKKNEVSKN
jgi:hypothetical protein